jgi:DNA helicase-2/ATP-dependent DNA helicase PcrA
MWQNALPSRFVADLPQRHVDSIADEGFYGHYGSFRDNAGAFSQAEPGGAYDSPGWRRVQAARAKADTRGRGPIIDAKARVVASGDPGASQFSTGERVFHQKFGYGRIVSVEGNKLLVDFEKAGSKRVMDGFVTRT